VDNLDKIAVALGCHYTELLAVMAKADSSRPEPAAARRYLGR
jgi:hypothetical protein